MIYTIHSSPKEVFQLDPTRSSEHDGYKRAEKS